jgi:proline dehydrogenase
MLAAVLRSLFLWLSHRRWIAPLALRTPILRRVATRFVAGTTLDEAMRVVAAINAGGVLATVDVLGEMVSDRDAAERAAADYVAVIERIAAERLDANVSLKLTQMGVDLGVETCLEVMRPVVEAGRRHSIFVRIDMEASAYVGPTLEVVRRLRADGYDVGPAIQAYLRRSPADVDSLAADRLRVRVCKGAYAEPDEIALQDRDEIRHAFVALVRRLLEADAYPAAATHDPWLIEAIISLARELGTPPERFEFQFLYGIRRDLQRRLVTAGYRVRIYVPFGTEWYPYFMRRLAERPANVLFVLRSLLGERR